MVVVTSRIVGFRETIEGIVDVIDARLACPVMGMGVMSGVEVGPGERWRGQASGLGACRWRWG